MNIWPKADTERLIELHRKGYGVCAIAAIMGKPRRTVRAKVAVLKRQAAKQYTTRNCLGCQRPFQSEGKHNRICGNCHRYSEHTDFDQRFVLWA